jgi:hypothetical protein
MEKGKWVGGAVTMKGQSLTVIVDTQPTYIIKLSRT